MARQAKAQTGTGAKPRRGAAEALANHLAVEDLTEVFDEVHKLTDEMEDYGASKRQKIGKVYEKAAEKLGMSVEVIKFMFREQRRGRKMAKKAIKMDLGDKHALEQCSAAFGPDDGFGAWLGQMAKLAGQEVKGEKKGASKKDKAGPAEDDSE